MVFDLKTQYETDPEREIEGVWEDLGTVEEGEITPGILIARVGNTHYMKEYQKIPRGIRSQMDKGSLPDKMGDQIISKLFAKTILLDWRGIADDGVEIKYSEENAVAYMVKYKDFREFVWEIGNEQARFRTEEINKALGNSKSALSGS